MFAVCLLQATTALVFDDGSAISVFVTDDSAGFKLAARDSSSNDAFSPNEAAWGKFNDTFLKTGWSTLEIHTNSAMDDSIVARAAGFYEGKATATQMEQHATNSGIPTFKMKKEIAAFLETNKQWQAMMLGLATQTPAHSADRAYWHQVGLVNAQLGGMFQGYSAARREMQNPVTTKALSEGDILLLNLGGDLEDLEGLNGNCSVSEIDTRPVSSPVFDKGRCSALLRLTKDNGDVMISQNTWSGLTSMLRIYKMYDFPYSVHGSPANGTSKPAVVPARKVSFSSYPGSLFSGDDFYVLSSGMVVQETTIGNSASSLNEHFLSPMTLLEWQRNIIANRLAPAGREWCGIFQKYNSGTYNNQNMILDYNLFAPGQPLQNDTFWLCEQIPGYVYGNDLSQKLQRDRYFGSYNTAYDENIRALSGNLADQQALGPWFSYEHTARAQIFRRDAPKVETLQDLKHLMRSCDFKHDPVQYCLASQMPECDYLGWTNCTPSFTAENCIATRGDLNPSGGVFSLGAFGHRNHISSDSKISQFSTYSRESVPADIISGPTNQDPSTPTFVWSTTSDDFKKLPHLGHPDKFDFDWVRVEFSS